MGCFFSGRNITIGQNSVINRNTYLDGRGKLTIGNNVSISPQTYIITLDHDPQSSTFGTLPSNVNIDDFCWVGARTMVLPGVTLKKGCVVGAGAVVTKSFEEFDIVAGVPAKVIGKRDTNMNYTLKYFPLFDTDILVEL